MVLVKVACEDRAEAFVPRSAPFLIRIARGYPHIPQLIQSDDQSGPVAPMLAMNKNRLAAGLILMARIWSTSASLSSLTAVSKRTEAPGFHYFSDDRA
jgi:hypothetical protein